MEIQEVIVFDGTEYRLMGGKRKYYLSQSNTNKGRKGAKGLHVAIWEKHHGRKIPKGFHIHHKDGDTFNNDIVNLECVSAKKHYKQPKKFNKEENKKHLEKIRPLTKEWHKSEEGRKWHREHVKKSLKKKEHTKECAECGREFKTYFVQTRFCERKCNSRYHAREWRKKHPDYYKKGV